MGSGPGSGSGGGGGGLATAGRIGKAVASVRPVKAPNRALVSRHSKINVRFMVYLRWHHGRTTIRGAMAAPVRSIRRRFPLLKN